MSIVNIVNRYLGMVDNSGVMCRDKKLKVYRADSVVQALIDWETCAKVDRLNGIVVMVM